jgi:hypothetical protein
MIGNVNVDSILTYIENLKSDFLRSFCKQNKKINIIIVDRYFLKRFLKKKKRRLLQIKINKLFSYNVYIFLITLQLYLDNCVSFLLRNINNISLLSLDLKQVNIIYFCKNKMLTRIENKMITVLNIEKIFLKH